MVAALRRHALAAVVPFLIFSSVVRAWWLPGRIQGDDFWGVPSRSSGMLSQMLPWPSLWDPTLAFGSDMSAWLPSFPLWAFCGALARLGLSWNVIERVVWLIPLCILIALCPYLLGYALTRSRLAAAALAAFFALNTWTVGLLQRGHIPSLCAFALIPLALVLLGRLTMPRPLGALALALVLGLQACYDMRYTYLTVALAGAIALVWLASGGRSEIGARLSRIGLNLVVAVATFAAVSSYWILPTILVPGPTIAHILSGKALASLQSFQDLAQAIAAYYPFYHYVSGTSPFATDAPALGFFVLPVLAVCSLVVSHKRAAAWGAAALAIVAGVMATGDRSPVGPLVEWVMHHVPGLIMFRETTKFDSLIVLAYAVLFAFGIAWARRLVADRRALAACALIGVAAYLGLMHSAYDTARGSNFATLVARPQDRQLGRYLASAASTSRTLFVPAIPLTMDSSFARPLAALYDLQNAFPIDDGSGSLLSYLRASALPRELAALNVSTVVLADDPGEFMYRRFGFVMQYDRTLAVLRSLPWLTERAAFGRYVVFATRIPPEGMTSEPRIPAILFGGPESVPSLAASAIWSQSPGVMDSASIPDAKDVERLGAILPNHVNDDARPAAAYRAVVASRYASATASGSPYLGDLAGTVASPSQAEWRIHLTEGAGEGPYVLALQTAIASHGPVVLFDGAGVGMDTLPLVFLSTKRPFDAPVRYALALRDLRDGSTLRTSGLSIATGGRYLLDLWGDSVSAVPHGRFLEDFVVEKIVIARAPAGAITRAIALTNDPSFDRPGLRVSVGVFGVRHGAAALEFPLSGSPVALDFDATRAGASTLTAAIEARSSTSDRWIPVGFDATGGAFDQPIPAQWIDERPPWSHVGIDLSALHDIFRLAPDARLVRLRIAAPQISVRDLYATYLDPASCGWDAIVRVASVAAHLDQHACSTTVAGSARVAAGGRLPFSVRARPPSTIDAVLFEKGSPAVAPAHVARDATFLEPSLIAMRAAPGAAMLALAQRYAPGWRAIAVTEDPSTMDRRALWDRIANAPSAGIHGRVDGSVNGWADLRAGDGWIVVGYAPTGIARRAAMLALVLTLLCVGAAFALAWSIRRRERRAAS